MNKNDRWFRPRSESDIVEEEVEAFSNDLEDDIEVNICDLRDERVPDEAEGAESCI